MNFFQIRYFVTVAQLENMSRAAELLHLSQSSLSKSVSKMEAELGMPLFDRSGKKIALNAQGERFLECCNLMLREMDAAVDDMNALGSGAGSKIKVGMAGAASRVIDCLSAFRQLHPATTFELHTDIEAQERIDINEYDVLVYPAGMKYDKFTGCRLGTERYALAVPLSHPLAELPSLRPKQLEDLDFVFLRKNKTFLEYPYQLCTALNLRLRSQCFADTREAQLELIASGMAVGFVPEGENLACGGIRLIPVDDPRFSRTMMLAFRREKHLSPLARALKEYLLAQLVSP